MLGCGRVLKNPEGHFTSPNYPSNYPNSIQCQWEIQAEYGHLIEITINDYDFQTDTDCKQDGLIVNLRPFLYIFIVKSLFTSSISPQLS